MNGTLVKKIYTFADFVRFVDRCILMTVMPCVDYFVASFNYSQCDESQDVYRMSRAIRYTLISYYITIIVI